MLACREVPRLVHGTEPFFCRGLNQRCRRVFELESQPGLEPSFPGHKCGSLALVLPPCRSTLLVCCWLGIRHRWTACIQAGRTSCGTELGGCGAADYDCQRRSG